MKITYGEYRLICSERCWQPKLVEQEKNSQLTVSTYALMWSNGNYYLVCRHRSMMNLRTDLSLPQYTQPNSQGLTEITMSIAAEGVKLFALQYADNVELLEPQWLREKSEIP